MKRAIKHKNPIPIREPRFQMQVIKTKKGKGSYKRKDRTQRSFYLGGAEKVLTIAVPKHLCPIQFTKKLILRPPKVVSGKCDTSLPSAWPLEE